MCSPPPPASGPSHPQDVVSLMVGIFTAAPSENLRATAASTLARLLRASPPLASVLLERLGVRALVAGAQTAARRPAL